MSMSGLIAMSEQPRRFDAFTGTGRRRNFTAAEKAAIVAESHAGEDSVCGVARRHGLTPTQLFTWRRLARSQPSRSAERPLFVPAIGSSDLRQRNGPFTFRSPTTGTGRRHPVEACRLQQTSRRDAREGSLVRSSPEAATSVFPSSGPSSLQGGRSQLACKD